MSADKQQESSAKKVVGRPWPKGVSGNAKGRPPGIRALSERLRAQLDEIPPDEQAKAKRERREPRTWGQILVESLLTQYLQGNATAIKEIWGRVEGKAILPIEHSGDLPLSITLSLGSRNSGEDEL